MKFRSTFNKHSRLIIVLGLISCISVITREQNELKEVAKLYQEYINTAYNRDYDKYLLFYSKLDIPPDSSSFIRWCEILMNLKISVAGVEKKLYDSTTYYEVHTVAYTKDGKTKLMDRYFPVVRENGRIVNISPLKLFTQNWNVIQSKYFNIYTKQDVSDSALADIDSFYEIVSRELKVTPMEKVNYYLCRDKNESGLLQGKKAPAGGSCFPGKTKTIVAPGLSYHEIVHAITYNIADFSLDFLVEGVATYYMFTKKPWKLDSIINEMKSNNKLVPLDTLIWNFRILPEEIAYFEAASFVKFLIMKYSTDSFIIIYKLAKSWDDFIAALPKVYGKTLYELEKEWVSWFSK